MGKEYVLEMLSRQEGRKRQGLPQHFDSISVLGVYAQIKFNGQDLPEGWEKIEGHITSCEECQYDVSNAIEAMKAEEKARIEYLLSRSP